MNRKVLSEAECIVRGDKLVIRPIKTIAEGEFTEQILAELIKEGLSGEELLIAFKNRQAQIRPAAEAMLAKAEDIATGKAEYETYEDVFETGK